MTNDGELEGWVERLTALRQYQHNGKRVPHKPLLVLMALGRLAETGSSELQWSETDLLTELPEGFLGLSVRLLIGVATFPARDQQRGCAAGAVRFGGATARVA